MDFTFYISPSDIYFSSLEFKSRNFINIIGGLAIAAHPFMIFGLKSKIFNLDFDAIETHNSSIPDWPNEKALKAAQIMQLPALCGSDAHTLGQIGNGIIVFSQMPKNPEEFSSFIKNKKFQITFRPTNLKKMLAEHIKENLNFIFNV